MNDRASGIFAETDRRVSAYLTELGLSADYPQRRGLVAWPEAGDLAVAGRNRVGHEQFLAPEAADAWYSMCREARADGIELEIVSGFRSVDRQMAVLRRKLAEGRPIKELMKVNVPPGFSQHHTGRALDLGSPDAPLLDTGFEHTLAFEWLSDRAASFGFVLPYPRDNPYGVDFEPWHWCLRELVS